MTDKETLELALKALQWFTAAEPWDEPDVSKAIKALEEALAKQEQGEPYAIEAGFDNGDGTYSVRIERYKKDLKTHKDWKSLEKLLYTTPQQRKPLTEFEKAELINKHTIWSVVAGRWVLKDFDLIDAVEAAHGIKE
jgi:hypothetical protein